MSVQIIEIDALLAVPPHALPPIHSIPLFSSSNPSLEDLTINRSASYTHLPGVSDSTPTIKRTFSDNVLSSLAPKSSKPTDSEQNANVQLFRRASRKTKKRMNAAKMASAANTGDLEKSKKSVDRTDAVSVKSLGRGAGALKAFSRKAWLSSSRSNSPSRKEESSPNRLQQQQSTESRSRSRPGTSSGTNIPEPMPARVSPKLSPQSNDALTNASPPEPKRESSSPKRPSQSVSEYSVEIESEASSMRISRRSSFSSIRSRASMDRMYLSLPTAKVPPMPQNISTDRLSNLSAEGTRKKDPHWIAFRSIDGEYTSFQSKTSMQKAKAVRTVLLPFLKKTLDSNGTRDLRAEDLDRRVVILNKWWVGLLDLLNGTGQQAISGTDRPAFLEAICDIMFRPEWKVPSWQAPGDQIDTRSCISKTDSHSSTDTDEPDFLIRTVYQNIRNMFQQNIIQQLTFVIERLSMRAAPASLVIFGGKTCAYAFFFCPSIPEILARLWRIPAGTLRRVLSEYGPNSGRIAGRLSNELSSYFPPALRLLCFTSHAALSRQLQKKAQPPSNLAHIHWFSPWVNRWGGRDSDLFFVFVKHFHILVADFVPRHLLPEERMGIPGLLAVHAQVLMVLESSLYRQAGNFAAEHYTSSDGPDAMAPMPMVIPNATRSVGENRLVVLLRDVIGDRRPENAALAEVLVGSFQFIFKAAVRKISMYNGDACFVLCDFLEELLPLVSRYQLSHVEEEDWEFWMKVFKQLMRTQTTMTQIRVIAFLYSTWPIVVANEARKRQMVLDWLLEPRFFGQYFNHWSPMVRHYFFRILCWRVGRCDGVPTEVDVEIYKRLAKLLNMAWAHHQYITADAEMRGSSPPSTNPCCPAPGRTLLIIRTDNHHRPIPVTSFDKLIPTNLHQSLPYGSAPVMERATEAENQQNTSKKRWNILKSINLFNGPTNNRPGEVTPPGSPEAEEDTKYRQLGAKGQNQALSRPSTPPHHVLTFRFALEFSNSRPQLPAQLRRLTMPTLPHTSQKVLNELNMVEGVASSERIVPKDVSPVKPNPEEVNGARYSGRALAEWAQVVTECRNFYTRRKQEGCPTDSKIETPQIAVENFRMFG